MRIENRIARDGPIELSYPVETGNNLCGLEDPLPENLRSCVILDELLADCSPELRFIVLLLRDPSNTPVIEDFREKYSLDWSAFRELVQLHGVVGHLFHQKDKLEGILPPEPFNFIREEGTNQAGRNLKHSIVLGDVVSRLRDRGIRCIPFKGPVLGKRLWEDTARRFHGDLDLRIDPDQWSEAVVTLRELGFRPLDDMARLSGDLVRRLAYHGCSFERDDGIYFDLQWRFFGEPVFPSWSLNALWDRRGNVKLRNRVIPCLSWKDSWRVTYLHHAKHHWHRLGWIMDLAQFLEKRPPKEVEEVLGWAEEKGVQKRILLGMWLANEIFDPEISPRVGKKIEWNLANPEKYLWSFGLSNRGEKDRVRETTTEARTEVKNQFRLHDHRTPRVLFKLIKWKYLQPYVTDFKNVPLAKQFPVLATFSRVFRLLIQPFTGGRRE